MTCDIEFVLCSGGRDHWPHDRGAQDIRHLWKNQENGIYEFTSRCQNTFYGVACKPYCFQYLHVECTQCVQLEIYANNVKPFSTHTKKSEQLLA
jgi:hypothetical protein